MSVYICVHCGIVTYCDFFPCSRCHFRPQLSDLCLKLLGALSDEVADVCEVCHESKGKIRKVMVVSSGCGNYFSNDRMLLDPTKIAFCDITEESVPLFERRGDCYGSPKNALNKSTQRYLKQRFEKRRFK